MTRILLTLTLLLTAASAHAMVVVDTTYGQEIDPTGSFSFDAGTGTNRMLLATFFARDYINASTLGNPINVNSVSYGGTDFTANHIGTATGTDSPTGATVSVAMFWLAAPMTGSNTFAFDTDDTDRNAGVALIALSNVVQSGPADFATSGTADGTSTTNTATVTTTAANSLIIGGLMTGDDNLGFDDNGQTVPTGFPLTLNNGTGSYYANFGYEAVAGAGSASMTWSWSTGGAEENSQALVAFSAIPEPSATALLTMSLSLLVLTRRRRGF